MCHLCQWHRLTEAQSAALHKLVRAEYGTVTTAYLTASVHAYIQGCIGAPSESPCSDIDSGGGGGGESEEMVY